MVKSSQSGTVGVELAPGVFTNLERTVVNSVGDPPPSDLGRYEITLDPADRWLFKAPGLRNLTVTAPYMHDGSLPTLRAVVEFYNRGGMPHDGIDPLIRVLDLDDREVDDLVAFLESLTGDNLNELVQDVRSERVSNPGNLDSDGDRTVAHPGAS